MQYSNVVGRYEWCATCETPVCCTQTIQLYHLILQQVALKERNKLKRESAANFDTVGDADRLLQQKDEEVSLESS